MVFHSQKKQSLQAIAIKEPIIIPNPALVKSSTNVFTIGMVQRLQNHIPCTSCNSAK